MTAGEPCPFGDPYCPCPDGDICHYVDDPVTGTKAWLTPTHLDWCATVAEPDRRCDCDCFLGRCPTCGAVGPCGFASGGSPLICRIPEETR